MSCWSRKSRRPRRCRHHPPATLHRAVRIRTTRSSTVRNTTAGYWTVAGWRHGTARPSRFPRRRPSSPTRLTARTKYRNEASNHVSLISSSPRLGTRLVRLCGPPTRKPGCTAKCGATWVVNRARRVKTRTRRLKPRKRRSKLWSEISRNPAPRCPPYTAVSISRARALANAAAWRLTQMPPRDHASVPHRPTHCRCTGRAWICRRPCYL